MRSIVCLKKAVYSRGIDGDSFFSDNYGMIYDFNYLVNKREQLFQLKKLDKHSS